MEGVRQRTVGTQSLTILWMSKVVYSLGRTDSEVATCTTLGQQLPGANYLSDTWGAKWARKDCAQEKAATATRQQFLQHTSGNISESTNSNFKAEHMDFYR